MSFIKIKDPRKREEIIKDLIETRKRIKDNFIARKVGEAEYQTGLTKLFKPVTETQKATTKEITEAQKATAERIEKGLLPIKEGIESLTALTIQAGDPIPAIKYTEKEKTELGALAVDGLQSTHGRTATLSDIIPVDAKKGLYRINKTPITIKDNDLYISDATQPIKGTLGLWELLTSQGIPNFKDKITKEDLNNYIIIMTVTKATYNKNNKRVGGNDKMKNLIKPLVIALEKGGEEYNKELNKRNYKFKEKETKDKEDKTEDEEDEEEGDAYKLFDTDGEGLKGKGLKILPSDPNALIDRFDLLFSSKKAGHTGVRNEIISILDELKRQGVINVNEYKKLNSLIKK